jgi:hypothetical protein
MGTHTQTHAHTRKQVPVFTCNVHTAESTMMVFKAVLSNPLGGAVLGKRSVCRVIMVPGRPKLAATKVRLR